VASIRHGNSPAGHSLRAGLATAVDVLERRERAAIAFTSAFGG
jgi:hypothetical protein